MQGGRLGIVALIAAAALWAQLALVPLAATVSHGAALDPAAAATALVALGTALLGVVLGARHPRARAALLLAGFPCTLGLFGLIAGRKPMARFDAPARAIAAATAVGFVAAVAVWIQATAGRLETTITPSERSDGTPPPPLRGATLGLISVAAVFIAVVAPAMVAERGPVSHAERLGGEGMVRAREALTAAGGLGLGLWLLLGAGSALLRRRPLRTRRATRGLALLLWGLAVAGLELLLDRAR